MSEKRNESNQSNTNVERINVEDAMRAAEILENKYEMLYEDTSEDDAAENKK